MHAPIYRPRRRVDPRTGMAFRSSGGKTADQVRDAHAKFRSRLKGADWFEASFNNSTPRK